MNFNPDPTKQAPEIIFSRKVQNTNHSCLIFSYNTASLTESHKHLGIVLDSRLDFKEHLEIIFKKVSKTIGLLLKLQNLLPRKSLITVYKSFIRQILIMVIKIITKVMTLLSRRDRLLRKMRSYGPILLSQFRLSFCENI